MSENKKRVGRPRADPLPHGVTSTYTNHKCRCDECKAAWAAYRVDYLARRKAKRDG